MYLGCALVGKTVLVAVDARSARPQVATLSYGDFMDPAEFEQGPYLITITAAGDVDNVYYTSSAQNFSARTSQSIAFLGGNENDTSPHIVSTVNTVGLSL